MCTAVTNIASTNLFHSLMATMPAFSACFQVRPRVFSLGSYACRIDQALNFTRLVLKDMRLVCGNASLAETWASSVHGVGASNRALTAPLRT
eukprot:COSAG02_NODE_4771_length_4995_cov_3.275735_2_plen_92_part_00